MQIVNILATMATATALLAPSVMGADFRLKKHSKGSCSGPGGPVREYNRNTCEPRYQSDHGFTVLDHTVGCKIRMYQGGNCDGSVVSAFSSDQCHGVPWNANSFRVEC